MGDDNKTTPLLSIHQSSVKLHDLNITYYLQEHEYICINEDVYETVAHCKQTKGPK